MSQDKPVLSPCPFCGSAAEVVHASHIRCINTYNCDCETRLGDKAWNRRALERQGWISVPKEPTDSMVKAGVQAMSRNGHDPDYSEADVLEIWHDMLTAQINEPPQADTQLMGGYGDELVDAASVAKPEFATGQPIPSANAALPSLKLSDDFGDPETLLNSRGWLQKAVEAKGAKMIGGGCGCGQADIDIVLEGCKFNISIRPIFNEPPQAGQTKFRTAPSPEGHATGPASGSPVEGGEIG